MQNGWPIAFQSPGTPSTRVCKMSELQSLPLFPEAEISTFSLEITFFIYDQADFCASLQRNAFFLLLRVQTISGKAVIPPVSG